MPIIRLRRRLRFLLNFIQEHSKGSGGQGCVSRSTRYCCYKFSVAEACLYAAWDAETHHYPCIKTVPGLSPLIGLARLASTQRFNSDDLREFLRLSIPTFQCHDARLYRRCNLGHCMGW